MSLVERAQEIRARLMNPPNAVADTGIDLKRKPVCVGPPVPVLKPVEPAIQVKVHEHSIDRILKIVAVYYGYQVREMLNPLHTRPFVRVRSIAAYIIRQCTTASLPNIGHRMGGRDHTVVMYNIASAAKRIQDDECYAAEVAALEKMVRQKLSLNPQ